MNDKKEEHYGRVNWQADPAIIKKMVRIVGRSIFPESVSGFWWASDIITGPQPDELTLVIFIQKEFEPVCISVMGFNKKPYGLIFLRNLLQGKEREWISYDEAAGNEIINRLEETYKNVMKGRPGQILIDGLQGSSN